MADLAPDRCPLCGLAPVEPIRPFPDQPPCCRRCFIVYDKEDEFGHLGFAWEAGKIDSIAEDPRERSPRERSPREVPTPTIHLPAHLGEVCCDPGSLVRTRCGTVSDVSAISVNWREVTCRRAGCRFGIEEMQRSILTGKR